MGSLNLMLTVGRHPHSALPLAWSMAILNPAPAALGPYFLFSFLNGDEPSKDLQAKAMLASDEKSS